MDSKKVVVFVEDKMPDANESVAEQSSDQIGSNYFCIDDNLFCFMNFVFR